MKLDCGLDALIKDVVPDEFMIFFQQLVDFEHSRRAEAVEHKGPMVVAQGRFTTECSTAGRWLREVGLERMKPVDCGDACSFLEKASARLGKGVADFGRDGVDLFVTDPPYGVNTEDDHGGAQGLRDLYINFFRPLIGVAAPRCQILCCVPEVTKNGQPLPDFVTREWVERQIILESNRCGFDVIQPLEVLPEPKSLFMPPYQWRSEKTLNRSVLHIILQRRDNEHAETRGEESVVGVAAIADAPRIRTTPPEVKPRRKAKSQPSSRQ